MASEGALKLPDVGAAATTSWRSRASSRRPAWCRTGSSRRSTPGRSRPQVAIVVYQGYLGLDSGIPQSVYSLDRDQIDRGRLERVAAANLALGESTTLPDGTTIAFTGYKEFASLQLSHDPGQVWVLGAAIALLPACSACCCCAGSGSSPGRRPRGRRR